MDDGRVLQPATVEFGAARFYYDLILADFSDTPFAERARAEVLGDLRTNPGRRRSDSLVGRSVPGWQSTGTDDGHRSGRHHAAIDEPTITPVGSECRSRMRLESLRDASVKATRAWTHSPSNRLPLAARGNRPRRVAVGPHGSLTLLAACFIMLLSPAAAAISSVIDRSIAPISRPSTCRCSSPMHCDSIWASG